jgi:hypothetical protein
MSLYGKLLFTRDIIIYLPASEKAGSDVSVWEIIIYKGNYYLPASI